MAACLPVFHDDDAPAPLLDEPRFETLGVARACAVVTPFRAWRGRSGRRYVVSVYAPDAVPGHDGAVLIAVRRTADGRRRILDAVALDGGLHPAAAEVRLAGADEIHLHLLGRDAVDRERVAGDLSCPSRAAQAGTSGPGPGTRGSR